jgi:hypothetical protein
MKRLALFLLLLVLGTGLGCYTMLRHPQAGDFVSEEPGTSCVDCHSGPEYSHWTDPYYSSTYGYSPSLWGAYYAQPWWYDQYWYPPPSGSGGGAPLPTGGRNAWDRGPGAPASPYVPPVGTGSVSSGSAGTATPSVTPADTSHTNKPDKPAKEEPKKEEPKRRAWGR